jgi:sulfonate transport system substrate-binding protein
MNRFNRAFVAALLSLLALIVPAGARAEDKPSVIRFANPGVGVGNRPVVGGSAWNLAHIRGLFEQEFQKDGIAIRWSFLRGAGPAVNELFANDLVDVASLGDLPSVVGKAGGLKTRVLLATGRGNLYIAVPSDSNIKTVQDLRGKKVGIFKGTATQLGADRILASFGLSEHDLRAINVDTNSDDIKLRSSPVLDPYIVSSYKRAVEDSKRYGLLRNNFSVEEWFDPSILNQVLKEEHLENFWPVRPAP